ncbi:MAG: protein phosphatase 2C domain-containing protein [Acidobacteriaceae bacterium]|nr:protein phosphatase 2C domain-containing protein [Acidobacteriaceae bacterium]
MLLKAKSAAKTDIGLVRRSNQDSFGLAEDSGLYVVCDGMGGNVGGEIASSLAGQTFLQTARQELQAISAGPERARNALWRGALAANRTVRMRAAYDARYRGMGTTLVAAHIENDLLTLINVGDSRAYLVRDAQAHQLTMDHSYVAESVRRGLMTVEQAQRSAMQSVITRAIGAEDDVEPDLYEEPLLLGDTLLLASDGLTRHVTDPAIGEILGRENQSAVESCRLLIEQAKDDGGTDNITCLVVRMLDANAELHHGKLMWPGVSL